MQLDIKQLSFNQPNALVTLVCNSGQEALLLKAYAEAWGKEKARQEALSKIYTIEELVPRLNRCRSTISNLIKTEQLRGTKAGGAKSYIVTEQAVREFLGDIETP